MKPKFLSFAINLTVPHPNLIGLTSLNLSIPHRQVSSPNNS